MNPVREYLMIGKLVALLGALAIICWQSSQIHRWHKHSESLQQTLDGITTAKDTQKVVTRDRIKTVTRTIRVADDKANQIETAPLPGNCQTPKEVLNADI